MPLGIEAMAELTPLAAPLPMSAAAAAGNAVAEEEDIADAARAARTPTFDWEVSVAAFACVAATAPLCGAWAVAASMVAQPKMPTTARLTSICMAFVTSIWSTRQPRQQECSIDRGELRIPPRRLCHPAQVPATPTETISVSLTADPRRIHLSDADRSDVAQK
jgi:hypothetical protein